MPEGLRWGMLGAAHIAQRALLSAFAASRNGRLVAVASRDVDKARALLVEHPDVRAVEGYDALLADPTIDAVYNPLPNSLHKEWSIRSLEAGKHVLCEKPIALNAGEAEEMAAAATASKRHLMEAFMFRFHPAMREFVSTARDAIHVSSRFGFTAHDEADIRLQALLGGGALLDVGCYTVSVSRWILGEPVDVVAAAHLRDSLDLTTNALLTFSGNRTATVWSSVESARIEEVTVITPTDVLRRAPVFSAREGHDPYQLMVESFGDSVLQGGPDAIPMSESIANMRVLDAIRESSRSRSAL